MTKRKFTLVRTVISILPYKPQKFDLTLERTKYQPNQNYIMINIVQSQTRSQGKHVTVIVKVNCID